MIDRDRMEKELFKIAESDDEFADAKTEVERATWVCKHTRAIVYEMVDGKSVEDRKQAVERSQKVSEAEDRRIKAIGVLEHLKAKRETSGLIVDVWRSLESTRRLGVIT